MGESNLSGSTSSSQLMTVPSTGLEFFEYRRQCFLAGVPYPTASSSHPPSQLNVPIPPPPRPIPVSVPPLTPISTSGLTGNNGVGSGNTSGGTMSSSRGGPGPSSSLHIARLEALLAEDGAEESDKIWEAGVGTVYRNLSEGRKLARGLKLGTVIKILRGAWIRDGTWPVDPSTSLAARPPDSPRSLASHPPTADTQVPPLPPLPPQRDPQIPPLTPALSTLSSVSLSRQPTPIPPPSSSTTSSF